MSATNITQGANTYHASAMRACKCTSDTQATWSKAIQFRKREEWVDTWCFILPWTADKKFECRNPTALEFPVDPEVSMKQTMSLHWGRNLGYMNGCVVLWTSARDLRLVQDLVSKEGTRLWTVAMTSSFPTKTGLPKRARRWPRNSFRWLSSGWRVGIGQTGIPAERMVMVSLCFSYLRMSLPNIQAQKRSMWS